MSLRIAKLNVNLIPLLFLSLISFCLLTGRGMAEEQKHTAEIERGERTVEKIYLQVEIYSDEQKAEDMEDLLKNEGLPVFVDRYTNSEGTIFRVVLVGPFSSEKEAKGEVERVEKLVNLIPTLIKRKSEKGKVTVRKKEKSEKKKKEKERIKRWSDYTEVSFSDFSGNTDYVSLSVYQKLEYEFSKKVTTTWTFSSWFSESDGERDAENYSTELRLDYNLSKRFYLFDYGGWVKDTFDGIDSRYYAGLGGGYKLLIGPKHFLIGEIGVTYVFEEPTDEMDQDYVGGRAFTKYNFKFAPKSEFLQSAEWLLDSSESNNWELKTETAVKYALNNIVFLKTSYKINYDNIPLAGTSTTDRIIGVSLVISY